MPFTKTSASADTCVLSDFIAVERADLLARLFPDGIWTDASVIVELQDRFGASVPERLRSSGFALLVERGYDPVHYIEMAEIKRRRPAMRHADIATVVLAGKHGNACLSSDAAVRKTCTECGILVAGQLGCLEVCIARSLLDPDEAQRILLAFVGNGLYLPQRLIDEFMRGARSQTRLPLA